MPVSPWVMRPRASTAVASMNTIPAPPCANLPRCTTCQSVTCPSSAEYWHIGETTMRFFAVTVRSRMGSKRRGEAILLKNKDALAGALLVEQAVRLVRLLEPPAVREDFLEIDL